MRSRAAKRDANETAVRERLESLGCSVSPLSGTGIPDLMVGFRGVNILMEVKDGDKIPSARRLKPAQEKWHAGWTGQAAVVETPDEAESVLLFYLLELSKLDFHGMVRELTRDR